MLEYDGNKFLRIRRRSIEATAAARDLAMRIHELSSSQKSDAELFQCIWLLGKEYCRAMRLRDVCAQIVRSCQDWISAHDASPSYDFPAPKPPADIEQAYADLERIASEQCELIKKRRMILESIDSDRHQLDIQEEELIASLEAAGEIPMRLDHADPEIVLNARVSAK